MKNMFSQVLLLVDKSIIRKKEKKVVKNFLKYGPKILFMIWNVHGAFFKSKGMTKNS